MVSEVISEKSEKSEDEVENVLRVGRAKWNSGYRFSVSTLWTVTREGWEEQQ